MKCGKHELDFGRKTFVMGILNVTPDSFSDGGRFSNTKQAVAQGLRMADEGADIIDVGGESTRPGSEPVSVEEEIRRITPVIEQLADKTSIPVSVDTYRPEVAFKAFEAGACILNDINALRTRGMAEFAANHNLPVVLMHMQGKPKTMQESPEYGNVVDEINAFFEERIAFALGKGVKRDNIILDPGVGFGKRLEHNLEILRNLAKFRKHNLPLMVGPSRKSFIGQILTLSVDERLEGTLAAVTASILNGADIVRVHDVKEAVRVAAVADAIAGR